MSNYTRYAGLLLGLIASTGAVTGASPEMIYGCIGVGIISVLFYIGEILLQIKDKL